jgi:hypothetical protein
MNSRLSALRGGPIAVAMVMLLSVGATPAGASVEIEKIWSFNGGEVAIHATAGGKLEGIVVTPTTFDECAHQAGEAMWTDITPQPDGSYWGFHQWLFEKSCAPNPTPGPTAWRVLQKPGGARDLLVCFSEPGGPQPLISPTGAGSDATRPCQESEPTGSLPVVVSSAGSAGQGSGGVEQISFANTVILPKATVCTRRGRLRIVLHDPKRDPLKEVVVKLRRHKLADVRGVAKLKSGVIVLKGLPNGSYTLKITATTVLDQKLSGKRAYRSCARRKAKHSRHRARRHDRS